MNSNLLLCIAHGLAMALAVVPVVLAARLIQWAMQ
jgi:hypothetical protein